MKYWTTIGDRSYELAVEGERASLAVAVDGTPLELDYYEVARGAIYSLILDGRSYELWVRSGDGGYVVFVAGHTLAEARIPQKTGLIVIAIRHLDPRGREGPWSYNPGPQEEIRIGDVMIVLGNAEQITRLHREAQS